MTATPTETPPNLNDSTDDTSVYEDYWGIEERTERHTFRDGRQWIEFKVMNEGQKAEFQRTTSKDLIVQGRSGDARVSVDPAGDRHKLIKLSVVGWNLMVKDPVTKEWSPQPFSSRALDQWLDKAPPKIIEEVEFAIRMANPWMQDDMTIEQIDEEMERLREMRRQKERDQLGEGRSSDS